MRRMAMTLLLLAAAGLVAPLAAAQEPAVKPASDPANPQTLFELLEAVRMGLEVEREENRRRVADFQRQQSEQERLLLHQLKEPVLRHEAEHSRVGFQIIQ